MMVQSPWKQFIFFTNIATLMVGVVVALQVDNACFVWSSTPDCPQHSLQCDNGTIFFTQAIRGFKPKDHPCLSANTDCKSKPFCCRNDTGQDCLATYTQEAFSDLTMKCWNRQSCYYKVPQAGRHSHCEGYQYYSGYSEVQYLCLSDQAILNIVENKTKTGSSLVLRYISPYDARDFTCLVEADDCSNHSVDVLLYRTTTTADEDHCTELTVSGNHWMPCSTESTNYATLKHKTPFEIKLHVYIDNDSSEAWAVIHSNTSSTLRVTCKPWEDGSPFPPCSPASTPSLTSERTASSSHDVTEENMLQFADSPSDTAGIVGGVVGTIVGLVVVALVITLVFLKRRNATGNCLSKCVAWSKGNNSSNSNSPAEVALQPGWVQPRMTPAQPTSLPVHDNSAATISDEAGVRDPDSDYNHLGQKPTSSASRDVTYGHLADGSDVIDYGYDHVTRGKPAVRSGDVINNVYNTPGLATCGHSDEDFYHTTGAANNRPDVINNVYNTPSPASEASSDVEFYNAASTPLSGRDVINNARITGPVESEAHEFTGDVADSPYELARRVT